MIEAASVGGSSREEDRDLNMALVALPTGIWWTALYPGIAMFVLVLGLSFIGEGLEKLISETS